MEHRSNYTLSRKPLNGFTLVELLLLRQHRTQTNMWYNKEGFYSYVKCPWSLPG